MDPLSLEQIKGFGFYALTSPQVSFVCIMLIESCDNFLEITKFSSIGKYKSGKTVGLLEVMGFLFPSLIHLKNMPNISGNKSLILCCCIRVSFVRKCPLKIIKTKKLIHLCKIFGI